MDRRLLFSGAGADAVHRAAVVGGDVAVALVAGVPIASGAVPAMPVNALNKFFIGTGGAVDGTARMKITHRAVYPGGLPFAPPAKEAQ